MDPITQQVLAGAAGAGGDPVYVDDVFSTYLYEGTGDGSAQTITNGIDLSGEGGLVWSKKRSASASHILSDTERGVHKYLKSDGTDAEISNTGYITQFNSDGYAIGGGGDINYGDMVSWTFRKAPGFFDVVTWTGNGTAGRTIPHSLGSVPGMIFVKRTDASNSWNVYHRSLAGNSYLELESSGSAAAWNGAWNNTNPTSTHFTVGNSPTVNNNGGTYVAYVFAHDDQSFGTGSNEAIIKCGSYTGDDSSANFVDLGFEPQWLFIKNIGQNGTNWVMFDVMRGMPGVSTSYSRRLDANTSAAEANNNFVIPSATGFTLSGSGSYTNSRFSNFIYMAIRRPNKPPTDATEVFNVKYLANGSTNLGFVADTNISNYPAGTTWYWNNRLTANKDLNSDNTGVEDTAQATYWDLPTNTVNYGSYGGYHINYVFRRAPGFFDVVCFEGTGSARTLNHNLAAIPEFVIVKSRTSSYSWSVYVSHLSSPRDKAMYLNDTGAVQTNTAGTFWGTSDFTSTQISLGDYANTNHNNNSMIAYLFASLDGISKIGTYSGTGNDINVDCGFSAGARFVLIKRTDTEISGATGTHWYVWDTARGIASGQEPYLQLNTTATQVNSDYIDPLNAGFTVTSSAPAALNASGGTYLFLAIA